MTIQDLPILLLEDLSHADWPPPWTQPRIERVLALISAVAATPAPPDLPRLADQKESVFSGWATVAQDPRAFLSLGPCSAEWLERSIDRLAPFAVITAGHFAARAGLPPSSPT